MTDRSSTLRRCLTIGLAVLAAGGTLAACGDDDDDDGGGSGATTTATEAKGEFTGEPVTIYNLAPIKNQISDLSDTQATLKSVVRDLNAKTGLGGHEVTLKTCNDTDANAELKCARDAIKDKAIAFVASAAVLNGKAFAGELAKAGIPSVGALALNQEEYAIPVNFPIYSPPFPILNCAAHMADAVQAKSFDAIAADLPIQKELLATLKGIAAVNKQTYGGGVAVPLNQTDYSGAVQQLKGDSVINILGPPVQAALFSAIKSTGKEIKSMCTSPSTQGYKTLRQVGADAEILYMALGIKIGSEEEAATDPLVKEYREVIDAGAEAGIPDAGTDKVLKPGDSFNAFLSMKVLEQAIEKVQGQLDSKTLLAALNTLKPDLGQTTAVPIDFSKKAPAPLTQLFNPVSILYKWDADKGDFVKVDGAKPQNVLIAFGALQKAQAAAGG